MAPMRMAFYTTEQFPAQMIVSRINEFVNSVNSPHADYWSGQQNAPAASQLRGRPDGAGCQLMPTTSCAMAATRVCAAETTRARFLFASS